VIRVLKKKERILLIELQLKITNPNKNPIGERDHRIRREKVHMIPQEIELMMVGIPHLKMSQDINKVMNLDIFIGRDIKKIMK
jgi:hypothetical protein